MPGSHHRLHSGADFADVVIVGSGAGGSAAAWVLANAGFRVVVLEKGPRFERSDFVHDEVLGKASTNMFLPSVEDDPHILIDHSVPKSVPTRSTVGWSASCVGGGTNHMGATLHRLHPHDFRLRQYLGPFGDVVDWPYGYGDLETYYSQAEWLVGVSGDHSGRAGELHRSRPFPMPPMQADALSDRFDEVCRARGLHPIATPRAVNSIPYGGRPACERCDFCSGFGCPVGARGSTQETLLREAEHTGRCDIRPNSMAVALIVGRGRRVTGVRYIDEQGVERFLGGSVVCVSCSAVESARLLLLSKTPDFPEGLANSSGRVGRHLQFHTSSSGRATFVPDRTSASARGSRIFERALMDYYFLPPGICAYPKGGFLSFSLPLRQPLRMAEEIAIGVGDEERDIIWGEELKARLQGAMDATLNVDFEVFQDGFANPDTFVELDPDVTDKWGLPVARIHYKDVDHCRNAGQWLVDRGLEVLTAMGASQTTRRGLGIRNPFMVNGTCRAGADPRTSVLNSFCRAHDLRNLFVVDGSFMPTSGGSPSTLTILANGLRVGDYIQHRARCGEF